MKRFLAVFCTVIMLASLVSVCVTAAGEGITFSAIETYTTKNVLSSAPLTFEAVINVPKSISGRAGVIFGNYTKKNASSNFEITNNGAPRFYGWKNSSTVTNLEFKDVDIRGNDYVHLAIAIDTAAGKAHCYVNGELKQTLSCAGYSGIVSPDPFMVGGDLRSGNDRYFQGKIKSVAVYSDLRTAEEIKADVQGTDTSDAALLVSYDLTATGDARLKDASKNANDLIYSNPHASIGDLGGMSFGTDTTYFVSKPYATAPETVEAWINLPKAYSARGGVIVGNYGAATSCLNFEIYSNGNPRLYYVDAGGTVHNFVFSAVDVRTGDWAHVAIVHDAASQKAMCYLNGELKATVTGVPVFADSAIANEFGFGGDCRSGNEQFFKGALRSVAVFSDARSADEVKADMQSVSTSADGLLAYYDTSSVTAAADVKDSGKGGYDAVCIRTWFKDKEPVTDYAYSFCVVGDTQKVAYLYPDQFNCIYDWIVQNKESKKIEYVFGLGDITDKDTAAEWEVVKREISKLNGVVPYSLVRGNHDGSANFNKYFKVEEYTKTIEGQFNERFIENSWRTFTVGEVKYLNITLDYGASDKVLNWAAGIIEQHPDHRVIITTHAYLFRDGTTLDVGDVVPPNKTGSNNGTSNNGDQMWDKLISKYENIFLVLSGHDPCDNIIVAQDKGVNGNVVTQMLIDPQGVDAAQGATGMVAMLYFSNDGKTITIENYSTVRGEFYMSTSQMVIEVPEYDPNAVSVSTTEPTVDTETPATDAPVTDAPATEAIADTTATQAPVTEAPKSEGGCGSALGVAVIAVLVLPVVVLIKKKQD